MLRVVRWALLRDGIMHSDDSVLKLEIESIVDLTNSKLLAGYSDLKETGKDKGKDKAAPDAELPVESPWIAEQ